MALTPPSLKKLPLALTLVTGSWLGAALALSGCGEDDLGGTAGGRVTLTAEVLLAPLARGPFVNDLGWELTVTEAKLSLEALRYFEGSPIARLQFFPTEISSPWGEAERALGALVRAAVLREAHAHPGHYVPGEALGEMLTPVVIDLMSSPSAALPGAGVTGHYRSGWLRFATPPATSELGSAAVRVVVHARQGDQQHELQLDASLADLDNGHGDPLIEGCPFHSTEGARITRDGAIQVEVDLTLWLDQLDPAPLAASDERVQVDPSEPSHATLHRAFRRGIVQAGAYRFSYQATP